MGFEINLNNLNKDKHKQQMEFLQEEIVGGTHKDYFLALNNEAGSGKTIYAEKALVKAVREGKKSIFCRKFIENCIDSAKRINELYRGEIAIALDHDNFDKYMNTIQRYPVVIITHEKYIRLSRDLKQQQIFSNGREIMVIDEEIDIVKPIVFNVKTYGEFIGRVFKFPSIVSLYKEITKELIDFIEINRSKVFFKPQNNMINKIRELKSLMDSNITKEYASLFDLQKKDFLNEAERLEIFLNNVSVADNKVLYNYDRSIRLWKLNNNIILDACANLNLIYKISSEFKVVHQERIVDHSNWCIHVTESNSCRSKKKKSKNFYEVVNKDIENILTFADGIVVIGEKDEQDKIISDARVQFVWFGNITGKNNWRNMNSCYITLNPQIPFPIYILKYMFYSGNNFENGDKWDAGVKNGVYRFRNKEFELLRQTTIASENYQALKRINRDNNNNASVYIINNDSEILNLIMDQLNNVRRENRFLNIEYEVSDKKAALNKEREQEAYYTKFIEVVDGLEKGVYQKKWIREQIGLENRKTFSKKVLNKQKVIDYMNAANIIVKGQNIIVS